MPSEGREDRLLAGSFHSQSVSQASQPSRGENAIIVPGKAANKGRGISMRVFIACAIILTAAVGLGGCWGHHEKAVVAEPLKLG